MNEIKFKGWNTEIKQMYSSEELEEDQLTLSAMGKFINVDSNRKENSEIYEHILPLQFTGLKDKNGKEIFEGDLVSVPWNHSKFVISFIDGCYVMGTVILSFYHKEVEVTGNIYETSTA